MEPEPLQYERSWFFKVPKKIFSKWVDDDSSDVFIAEEKGKILGFVNVIIREAEERWYAHPLRYVEIDNLIVTKNEQNKGIGKKLILSAEKWAKDKDIETLIIAARANNDIAINLYKKLGYEPTSVNLRKKI